MSGILWFELLILCPFFVILLINLLTYPRLQGGKPSVLQTDSEEELYHPLLSILLPARNEEKCIEACVRSLLAQDYEPLEVLVLDDQSEDGTANIVQRLIDELPVDQGGRLQLLRGEAPVKGWIGKNFACHQLAAQAKGDLLYFTDADTIHAPDAARAVVECMHSYGVQLLTGHPEYVFGSWGERMLVPLLNFSMLTVLPLALVPRRPEPMLSNGNGQLMCFQRTTYVEIGGHSRVRASLIEDVELARLCKAEGNRMIFVDAHTQIRCRMYRSFADTMAGFSKSQFASYNYQLFPILFAIIFLLTLFVIPPVLAILFFSNGALFFGGLAVAAYLLAVVMRIMVTLRCYRKERVYMVLLCFLHPLSILMECLAMLNSIRLYYSKDGIPWKGRTYKQSG